VGENTKIEWCDHSWNPWVGCQKISPACDHCYAESWAKRTGSPELWSGHRRRTSAANWRKPPKWNREHYAFFAEHGRRQRVFCASLADVFDNEVEPQWRHDLFSLIHDTPHLDWLLLTKRIGNALKLVDAGVFLELRNIWLGATVVNQDEANRDIPKLLDVPARVRFLSCEPLISPVNLTRLTLVPQRGRIGASNGRGGVHRAGIHLDALRGLFVESGMEFDEFSARVDWTIVGGESGPRSRPMNVAWCESLREQCLDAGVAFFMKQGSRANWPDYKNFESFPPSLQVREFPA
jgi:protein gp37